MKKFTIYLALVVVLSLSFVIPCFAAPVVSGNSITWDGELGNDYITQRISDTQVIYYVRLTTNAPSYDDVLDVVNDGGYIGTIVSIDDGVVSVEDVEPIDEDIVTNAPDYTISDVGGFIFVSEANATYGDVTFSLPGVYGVRGIYSSGSYYGASVTIPGFSFTAAPWSETESEPDETIPTGIYWDIFDILHSHIYGGVELTSDMNLVLTMLSTTACLFCFAVPFAVVWWVIKRVT